MRCCLIILALTFIAPAGVSVVAQSAENRTPIFSKPDDESRPKSFRESLEKMRIEKEKKDYQDMMERGKEALKLSENLEKSFAQRGTLTKENYAQIAAIEKLTKKIRNDLGGDDDGEDKSDSTKLSDADGVKTLRERVVSLYDELKKTTRFSISAAAIEGTNAVLRVARFLKIAN